MLDMRKIKIPDTLTTLAYKTIRNYIWEGHLDTGGHLTEEFLSRQLGISKSPIREALNRLESEGLIRIEPRRGAYLRTYSIKEIQDLYDLREALEAHAVARAVITEELIQHLRSSVERARHYLELNDKLRYIEEDVGFHNRIALATGNALLVKTLENLQQQVWLFRRKTYDLSRSKAIESHAAITEALAKADKQQAEKLMREHISTVCARLVAHLEEEGSHKPAQPPASLHLATGRQPGAARTSL